VPTIIERALQLVPTGPQLGLGSGRAALSFVRALASRMHAGLVIRACVPTSNETADLARSLGLPLATLAEVPTLDATFDGADEVDPQLNLIKGYGRALVREKIVAASSRKLVILVGEEKLVPRLGSRGRLPIEVMPFALPLCERRLAELGLLSQPDVRDGKLFVTDNGNHVLDCAIGPLDDPSRLDADLRAIAGVVGTGLFLNMATTVLVGRKADMELVEERVRR